MAGGFLFALNGLFVMLRMAGSFPKPLTAKEEEKLLSSMAEGDMTARDKLIEHNLRLVAHIIKKYYAQGAEQDDLVSVGTIGLIKGVTSFKPEKGKLSTYAARCIENEVLMYFRARKKLGKEVSLSETIEGDSDSGTLSLMDVVSVDDTMLEDVAASDMAKALRRFVETALDERERQIVRLRYGLGGEAPLTQRDTARLCGISRSYVSRIEKQALLKLRNCFENG